MEQKIANKIKWLRISYWTVAVIDLIFGIVLVFISGLTKWLWQLDSSIQGADLMWTKYLGSVFLTWTCLAIWADRKPMERKGILLLTCFPGVASLIIVEVYAIILDIASVFNLILLVGMKITAMILVIFSYINARK